MENLIKPILDFFSSAHPVVQLCILVLLIGGVVVVGVLYLRGRSKLSLLKMKLDVERGKVQKRERKIRKLQGELAQADKLREDLRQATKKQGELGGKLKIAEDKLKESQKQSNHERDERLTLQSQIDRLQALDADVWARQAQGTTVTRVFVPSKERRARLVTFLNLKGGVGKTTLTANLAGAYATGVIGDKPLRVLLVDLDYQGTLGNMCVCGTDIIHFRNASNTVRALLNDANQDQPPSAVLAPLLAPFDGARRDANVIVADEALDHLDFRQQARFAVQQHEVRYFFRYLFHDPFISNQFDFVFFDCPPRLTTSSINALAASDWVVIPTGLHRNDVDAVPRTMRWLANLRPLLANGARLAGVILNRTHRPGVAPGCLTVSGGNETSQYELLLNHIQAYEPLGGAVLENVVPISPLVMRWAAGSIPLGTQVPEGHDLFGPLARELYTRIRR